MESLGYNMVRYTNRDVSLNIQGVYEDLLKRVNSLEPLPASPLRGGGDITNKNAN